jgi:radical SAM superfamily enzyme YgiQ (UPF0313 family)
MARIVLINPEFKTSYWNFNHSLKIFGRKAVTPTSALPLLAALTPETHEVILMDEAVEPLDFAVIASADIVGLTGMIVQRERMREIARELKSLGAFLVVGGPWITVQENDLKGLADVIFVGEADETWPLFLKEWAEGTHQPRYEQTQRTDMKKLPAQRLDLLKIDRYLQGSIQMSRGCPFLCEFCDIIVTFGRTPRVKSPEQVLEELEAWYQAGIMAVFLVDDNVIGNRKALVPILEAIAEWQKSKSYLVALHTEASINLADDDELLELFVRANIRTVFVGIETPNSESLRETRKMQNIERGSRKEAQEEDENSAETFLLRQIHKIQSFGIKVTCGLIVGFDSDPKEIFEIQRRFIEKSAITQAMVGLLSAIPKTPLHERLQRENRLDLKDPPDFGTNVIPLRMSREVLAEGYLGLIEDIYSPKTYFERLNDLYVSRRFYQHAEDVRVPNISRITQARYLVMSLVFTAGLFGRLFRHASEDGLRWFYLRQLLSYAKKRPYPMRYFDYVVEMACHYHFYRYTRDMTQGRTEIITTM